MANAVFRAGTSRAKDRQSALQAIDAGINGYLAVLKNAKVNDDAMGEGWFIKLRLADPKELDALMDEAAYQAFVAAQEQH